MRGQGVQCMGYLQNYFLLYSVKAVSRGSLISVALFSSKVIFQTLISDSSRYTNNCKSYKRQTPEATLPASLNNAQQSTTVTQEQALKFRPLNLEVDLVVRKAPTHPQVAVKPTISMMGLMHIHLF